MRERRYVKFKLDIYDDTKTKIIDQKLERDFIHYFFARCIVLAGKSDCEGKLYMARDIPYTIETLAIEFNRDTELVKLALDVLMELKMIEMTEDNIYKVKSFAKHQNIKVKEKLKSEIKEVSVKNVENATVNNAIVNEDCDKEEKNSKKQEEKDKEFRNNIDKNEVTTIINEDRIALEINPSGIKKEYNMNEEISNNINENSSTIPFETKKNKKVTTKKKKEYVINVSDEDDREDEESVSFKEGEYVLSEGERLISAWTF